MKNNKPRSREHRTKPMTAGATKMVKVHMDIRTATEEYLACMTESGADARVWDSSLR